MEPPIATVSPSEEIPDVTKVYMQPANELPTETAVLYGGSIPTQQATGNIDVRIIPPTTPSTQNVSNCSENGKLFSEGENWNSGPCKTCNCTQGRIICFLDENCSKGISTYICFVNLPNTLH